jgi:predicted DNA-binding protein (UPF0251 family)
MAREKIKRTLNFKPIVKAFGPLESAGENSIILFHEEIEAIYLMDLQGLYQADAAKKMDVSRPTFSRIMKSAHEKVAMALISGANLIIQDQKEDYRVAFCSSDKEVFTLLTPQQPFVIIYHIELGKVVDTQIMDNPVYVQKGKPGQLLPSFLSEHNVNFFVSSTIGEGLKNSLRAKGISPVVKKKVVAEAFRTLGFLEDQL